MIEGNKNREIHIWCDESDKKGKYFSHFYGGVLVEDKHLIEVKEVITKCLEENNLHKELKWQKVTGNYLDKYKNVISVFFKLISEGKVKMRIMFTANANVPLELSEVHKSNEYFLLYYQFFKHGFGLRYLPSTDYNNTFIRAYFDQLPDTKRKRDVFKDYIRRLSAQGVYSQANIKIEKDHISEVDSKDHVLLQCMDVVLGSMSFRLNDKHKEKPVGSYRRGKKTIAKEKLYRHILTEIRKIRPNFNIGKSTSIDGDYSNRWHHPYRHWVFKGKETDYDQEKTKNGSNKST